MSWHLADEALLQYQKGRLRPPFLWSADEHLLTCGACRIRLNALVGPDVVETGWNRLDARLDDATGGPAERMIVALGVPDHTARLLCATPTFRRSWLAAAAATLTLAVIGAYAASTLVMPIPLLATAPLLPLVGVALSFGPGMDPSYDIALVAPISTFRLILLRTVAVLAATSTLSLAASVIMPQFGPVAFGWLLPALVLTILSLTLMTSSARSERLLWSDPAGLWHWR
jgi:hypothetical protein